MGCEGAVAVADRAREAAANEPRAELAAASGPDACEQSPVAIALGREAVAG